MCYAKPGPRCTTHARQTLKNSEFMARRDPSPENLDKVQKAQKDFDATVGGARELRTEIDRLQGAASPRGRGARERAVERYNTIQVLRHRLSEGITNRQAALAAFRDAQAVEQAENTPQGVAPVIVQKTKLKEPGGGYSSDLSYSGVDYDYDSKDCAGCYNCQDYYSDDDYYNRGCTNEYYENLRVSTIDLRRTLASTFHCHETDISEDLMNYGRKLDLENPDSYTVEPTHGYYGVEGARVDMNNDKVAALREWYFQKNNAEDYAGVLSYCRSKGTETTATTPLDAIKRQVGQENDSVPSVVANATKVSVGNVKFNKIKVKSRAQYEAAEPKPMRTYGGSHQIAGVLYQDSQGELTLIDGHSRLKNLSEGNRKSASYIILSGAPERPRTAPRAAAPARAAGVTTRTRGGSLRKGGSKRVAN